MSFCFVRIKKEKYKTEKLELENQFLVGE